jgi:hypothetical protein
MPFSTLLHPTDVARAQGALDTAWREIKDTIPDEDQEKARTKLAYFVASYALVAGDDAELARLAVARLRKHPSRRRNRLSPHPLV